MTRGLRSVSLAVVGSALVLLGTAVPALSAGEPLLTVGVDLVGANSRRATYSLVVTNRGEGRARSVLLSAEVPEHTTFLRSSPRPSSRSGVPDCVNRGEVEPAGTTCEWNLGLLKPGRSVSVTIVLKLLREEEGHPVVLEASTSAIDAGPGGEATDVDDSLQVTILMAGTPAGTEAHDTWVRADEPEDTNHGACPTLTIASGGVSTAYLRFAPLPTEDVLGRVHSAILQATLVTTSYPVPRDGSLSVHALSGDAWGQGSGGCEPDNAGTDSELRNGVVPTMATEATADAFIGSPETRLSWDVSSDLLDEQQRSAHIGWAVVDHGDAGSTSELASSETVVEEGATNTRPRLTLVHQLDEPASCVDLSPEGSTGRSRKAINLEAYATDGDKIALGGNEACGGAIVPGQEIEWEIEDDDPDTYIARVFKKPTTNQPNAALTRAKPSGFVTLSVKLAHPKEVPEGAETKISARLVDTTDPDERALTDICHLGLPLIEPCASENATEDDAIFSWSTNP